MIEVFQMASSYKQNKLCEKFSNRIAGYDHCKKFLLYVKISVWFFLSSCSSCLTLIFSGGRHLIGPCSQKDDITFQSNT